MSLVTPSSTPLTPSTTPATVPDQSTLPASATADATNPNAGQQSGGFFGFLKRIPGDIGKGISDIPVIGKAATTVMSWAAKPLQEIQKDYKFIHSLYADHGFGAGLLGTLAVVAGAAAGSLLGPEGTVIGTDLAGMATRNILGRVVPNFKDSFDKSNDPNYLVSFGRDLAHGLSKIPGFGALGNTNTGVGQIVSGIADASFDFEGDPLAVAGKFKAQVKRGDMFAVAKEIDPITNQIRTVFDESGKPIVKATLPFGSSGTGVQNFLLSNSLVVHSSDQLDSVLANPLAGNVNRAIDDIVNKATSSPKTAAADIANTYGVKNGWSRAMSVALSKVENRDQVVQIFKQAMYSNELADSERSALSDLKLPTKSVGKLLSEKIGVDRIRNSEQGTNFNDQVNLLLPRKSAVMEKVTDESGNESMVPKVDPTTGKQVFELNKGALFSKPGSGQVLNALAGKVRNFTGRRPLSFDKDDMALSAKQIDLSDPNLGQTIYDIAYLSMPHRLALEHSTKFLTASGDEERMAMLHTLHQEVLKNLGVADAQATPLFSQLKNASVGSEADHGVYGTINGQNIGAVDMQDGTTKNLGIAIGQRYKGAMIDLKEARRQLRAAKAYGVMYNKADDFFTKYTNVVFAPLALLSPAFGLRVSAGEALHQVIRRGLGSYLNNALAHTISKLPEKYQPNYLDKTAMKLTQADLDAIEKEQKTGVPQSVTETEITKELNAKESRARQMWNAGNKVGATATAFADAVKAGGRATLLPAEWTLGKFAKSNLGSYLVKDKIKYMDEYENVMGTREPTAGVNSRHQASQAMSASDEVDTMVKTQGHGMVPGQELAGLSEFDPHFHAYWAKNLNMASADMAQRDIARAYLNASKNPAFRNMSVDDQFASLVDGQAANIRNPNMYKEYRGIMDGYTKAIPESFAKSQVDYLHGLVRGVNGEVNTSLVQKVANGEQFTAKELRSLGTGTNPIKVLGRRMQPNLANSLQQAEEKGYRAFVNPVMDFVSRSPLFNDFYIRRRMTNQTLVDMGLMTPDEVVRQSAIQATKEMIPAIHSPAIRSQFAVMHRNLLPFFFAQEQAMRRTGRLILTNPQAFRDFQIIQQGMNNPGFVHTDANGQKYIVYPGLGEFGNALSRGLNALGLKQFTGLPSSITGNTASLLTVLPEVKMPGTSPFVNFGLTELSKRFPWLDKAVNVASGGYPSQNFIDTIIPSSTMRDLFNSMNMDERESTVYNSKLSAIMAAYYHGDLPDNFTSLPAFQQQEILTKIEHNAQSNLIAKGILAFFLPLSPTVSNDYYDKNMQTLRSEYLNLLNQTDPKTGAKYTAASALNKFIADNGERALSYTIARTASGTSGAYAPLADSTVTWINNNQPLLTNPAYSTAAPYLIPQVASSPDALSVENKLLTNHFRAKVSATDFINSLYVKQGWQDLSQAYSAYQADVNRLRAVNDKNGMYQAGQQWRSIAETYGQSNPIWYQDYMNPTKLELAKNAITQFQTMQDKGYLKTSPQGQKISEILDNYKLYHQDLLANTYNGKHLPGYSQAQDSWYTYMDNLAAADPQLSSVITSVFRRAV